MPGKPKDFRTPDRRRAVAGWLRLYFSGDLGDSMKGIRFDRDYETTTKQPPGWLPEPLRKRLDVALSYGRLSETRPDLADLLWVHYGENRPYEWLERHYHRTKKNLISDVDLGLNLLIDDLWHDDMLAAAKGAA